MIMIFVYLIAGLVYYNLRVFLRTAAFEMLSYGDLVQSLVFAGSVTYVFYWFSR